METLLQDLKFALRGYRRAPAFPLAAILTLALGIGATTAIFSTLNAVLLKPLPYPQAEDLYNIRTALTDGRVTTGMLSNGEVSRLNGTTTSIVRAAGMQQADLTLLHEDGTPDLASRGPRRPPGHHPLRRSSSSHIASGKTCIAAIQRSSASRSASRKWRRRSPAWRRATSTRRTAATSGSASSSTKTTSIISSTASCG
jgi:hypothetical protein